MSRYDSNPFDDDVNPFSVSFLPLLCYNLPFRSEFLVFDIRVLTIRVMSIFISRMFVVLFRRVNELLLLLFMVFSSVKWSP